MNFECVGLPARELPLNLPVIECRYPDPLLSPRHCQSTPKRPNETISFRSRVDTKFRNQKLPSYFAKWSYYYYAEEYREISRKNGIKFRETLSIWQAGSGSRYNSNQIAKFRNEKLPSYLFRENDHIISQTNIAKFREK
jgi:hypothetical protein